MRVIAFNPFGNLMNGSIDVITEVEGVKVKYTFSQRKPDPDIHGLSVTAEFQLDGSCVMYMVKGEVL